MDARLRGPEVLHGAPLRVGTAVPGRAMLLIYCPQSLSRGAKSVCYFFYVYYRVKKWTSGEILNTYKNPY